MHSARLGYALATSVAVVILASSCGDADPKRPAPCVLFAADIATGSIVCLSELDPAAGTSVSARVLASVSGIGTNLAYDAPNDRLYAVSDGSIVVFDRASAAAGNQAPSRTITPVGTSFVWATALFLDKSADVLYLGGYLPYGGAVLAFSGASSANGARTPDRKMTFAGGVAHFTLDTSRSLLYAISGSGIQVIGGATTANGAVTPLRTLGGSGASGLSLDEGRDKLYVTNVFSGITILSGVSGSPTTVVVPMTNTQFVTVDDANDRLYVGAYDKAYILDGGSTLAGGSVPAGAVQLQAPAGSSIAGFAFP